MEKFINIIHLEDCVLFMYVLVFSRFSSFLPRPKFMPVGKLAVLNCS